MVSWKKIWIALLLVIAGTGQLPLWLHNSLCHHDHGSGSLATCHGHGDCSTPAGESDSCPAANKDIKSDSDCPWDHDELASNSEQAGRSGSKAGYSWSAKAGTDAHNCAACYFLSQSVTACSIESYEPPATLVAEIEPNAQRWIALEVLAVYASRAPPAI